MLNNLLNKEFNKAHVGIDIPRSQFGMPSNLKTSFNAGDLIPIYLAEVLPGDTWQMDTKSLIRTSSALIKPVMDNMYMDIHWFFVPNRLVWEHWEEFNGANPDGYWTQPVEYEIPQLTAPTGSCFQS